MLHGHKCPYEATVGPPLNIAIEERREASTLSKDPSITILPSDKGRCTVILNTSDYHTKITSLLSDCETYEVLKKGALQQLQEENETTYRNYKKDHIIDRLTYYCL